MRKYKWDLSPEFSLRQWVALGFLVGVVVACTAVAIGSGILSATTADVSHIDHHRFTLTSSSNSDFFRLQGTWVCYLAGTFDTGTVDLAKLDSGTQASPTTKTVNISNLDDASADIGYTTGTYGTGLYRWEVTGGTGSTAIVGDCANANR